MAKDIFEVENPLGLSRLVEDTLNLGPELDPQYKEDRPFREKIRAGLVALSQTAEEDPGTKSFMEIGSRWLGRIQDPRKLKTLISCYVLGKPGTEVGNLADMAQRLGFERNRHGLGRTKIQVEQAIRVARSSAVLREDMVRFLSSFKHSK